MNKELNDSGIIKGGTLMSIEIKSHGADVRFEDYPGKKRLPIIVVFCLGCFLSWVIGKGRLKK